VVILIETEFINYKCLHMRLVIRIWELGFRDEVLECRV